MITLGVYDGHDASACIVENGKLLSVIQEERLNRIKKFSGFPRQSIKLCLDILNLKQSDVDNIAFSTNEFLTVFHTNFYKPQFPTNIFQSTPDRWRTRIFEFYRSALFNNNKLYDFDLNISKKLFNYFIRKMGFENQIIYFVDHHIAHTMTALSMCQKDTYLIFTLDGQGNGISGTISIGKNGSITERISEMDVYASLGHFYGGITEIIGFRYNFDEGKTMALAPFGNANKTYNIFKSFFDVKGLKIIKNEPIKKSGRATSLHLMPIFNKYKKEDVAAGAQKILEDVVCRLISNAISETGIKNILLAGGIFLNVKLNKKISELPEVKNMFVYPGASDCGISIGAALKINNEMSGKKSHRFSNPSLGDSFSHEYMKKTIRKKSSEYKIKYEYISEIEKYVAEELLQNGKIGGWFQGKMEFGLRALGNRSILADPRDKSISNILNSTIKKRPAFQPFCQSILDKAEKKYVVNPKKIDASYMIISFDSTQKGKIETPAVVHVDNSIRPQVVSKSMNPKYYSLLKSFGKETGIPVVLNTSFNRSGEPIVHTPEEAIDDLVVGSLDFLAIGNYLVERI